MSNVTFIVARSEAEAIERAQTESSYFGSYNLADLRKKREELKDIDNRFQAPMWKVTVEAYQLKCLCSSGPGNCPVHGE